MEPNPLLLKHITCFAIFFIVLWISSINKSHKLFIDRNRPAENPGNLIGLQLAGLLWLGLIPGLFTEHLPLQIVFGNRLTSTFDRLAMITAFAAGIALILSQTRLFIPVIKCEALSPLDSGNLKLYLTVRIVFIIFSEMWFRGLFLQDSIAQFGIPLGLALNMFVYSLMHSFGTKREIIFSIPFGFILCVIVIYMNAVWPVILIQLAYALGNDWRSMLRFYKLLKPAV